jgi:hypothetical protein
MKTFKQSVIIFCNDNFIYEKVNLSLSLTKHYAMKTYGGADE